jgi:hypothetical protein
VVFRFSAFRDGPEKYSEIYASSTTGEVREIFNGKSHHVQTDFGLDMDLPDSSAMTSTDLFSPVLDLASAEQLYASLSYTGSFDREGRNAAVLEGMTKDGAEVALAFDVETGLLVNLTRGYISISLGDYRKVGEVMLPFKIDRGRVGNMSLEDVTVNSPIDASLFLKKERCFDKVN